MLAAATGRVNPNSGEHDPVAAADGPAFDNRGVNADVHSIVFEQPCGGFLSLW
jgi:hypothetical protein